MSELDDTRHVWLIGSRSSVADSLAALAPLTVGAVSGHRRLRGPFTAAGGVLRRLVPSLAAAQPDLVRRHDIEILVAAPELSAIVPAWRTTITSRADPQTRTRFYPHDRVRWIGHGITDLLLAAADTDAVRRLAILDVDRLDPTDAQWLAGLLRRSDPRRLHLVLASASAEVTTPLTEALDRYARRVQLQPSVELEHLVGDLTPLAAAYVDSDGLAADPALQAAYEATDPQTRARLHDNRADHLESLGEPSLLLGAVPYHRERGSDPRGAGTAALSRAIEHCIMAGLYDAVLDLGFRLRTLLTWENDPQARWLATVKMTTALQAMSRPDEAMDLFDEACAGTTLPAVHMQAAYGRAMVYTRYYEEERRDLRKAKALVNTAVALSALSSDEERQAYNRTFNENGLALIEMHLGRTDVSLALVEAGIDRLNSVGEGRWLLHRSVLRYNRTQLIARRRPLQEGIAAYDAMVEEDPFHPDYHFERADLLARAGRTEEAIASYTAAATVGPPYAEPYYNRGDLRLRAGDLAGAVADFDRVLELEPGFLDAYINRASLRLDDGDHAGAEADVEAGLALDPAQPHLLCLSGTLALERGHPDEARVALEAAVAADELMPEAWANLGIACFEAGDAATACRCFERSLDITENPDVRENLSRAQCLC
jgi:tetratricopeptide (TPR) repeat protein